MENRTRLTSSRGRRCPGGRTGQLAQLIRLLQSFPTVQRSTVSVVTRNLQTAGLIQHGRGSITVTDGAGLEEAVCECYNRIQRIYQGVMPGRYPLPELGR